MAFKVIIAGSRSFNDYKLLEKKCDIILSSVTDEIWIISGTAHGADKLGEDYAKKRGYRLVQCPAPWNDIDGKPYKEIGTNSKGKLYWIKAGHARNVFMAEQADALIAFNYGTGGTNDMIKIAKAKKLKVREIKL